VPELYRDDEAARQPPEYVMPRSSAGREALLDADEDAWAPAPVLAWGAPRFRTRFRALWTAEALAVRFDVEDHAPWHTRVRRDDCLWEEEVVEIFLDPLGRGSDYVELEISPANVVCDLHIASLAPDRDVRLHWDFVTLESRVHRATRTDDWTATAWLPYTDFLSVCPEVAQAMPPAIADIWRFNVFRIKRPHGPAEPERDAIYAAWSVPDGPSFHAPEAFRPLIFGDC